MVEENESNALALKRLIALSKTIPNNNQATCARLNQYLKLFPTDIEAVSLVKCVKWIDKRCAIVNVVFVV